MITLEVNHVTINNEKKLEVVAIDTASGESVVLAVVDDDTTANYVYQEAKEKLESFENKTIEILRDKTNEDKYERKLRYVFYKNRFINKEILEEGLASLYMCEDLRYESELRKTEEEARKEERGIWKVH